MGIKRLFYSHLEHVHRLFEKNLTPFCFIYLEFDSYTRIILSQLHGLCLLVLVVIGIANTLKHHLCPHPTLKQKMSLIVN